MMMTMTMMMMMHIRRGNFQWMMVGGAFPIVKYIGATQITLHTSFVKRSWQWTKQYVVTSNFWGESFHNFTNLLLIILLHFLSTLVALNFTPVSKSVSR